MHQNIYKTHEQHLLLSVSALHGCHPERLILRMALMECRYI